MELLYTNGNVSLRLMEDREEDYRKLHLWLNEKEVLLTYSGEESGLSETEEKYRKRIKERKVIPCFFSYGEEEIGYFQYYEVDEDSYEITGSGILDGCRKPYGIDLFIGEPSYLNRGIGTDVLICITKFLFEEGADVVLIDPIKENVRAIRAYHKAGFRDVHVVEKRQLFMGEYRDNLIMKKEKNYMEGIIFKRRSVRKYIDREIEKEKIERIVRAAQLAPSAMAVFPWEIVVTTDREKMKKVAVVSPYGKFAKDAGAVFIVCGNLSTYAPGREQRFWIQDCSAAIENILLQIVEEGLGGVWLGVYPNEERCQDIREIFGIPEDIIPLGTVVCGYSDEENIAKDRFDESKVHYEQY